MAASPTPDPLEVRRRGRQRLIGAIALVLLAVVFVPMILDPEPAPDRGSESRAARNAMTIPSKEGAPALPAPLPAATAPAAEPAASTAEPKAPSTASKAAELKVVEPKAAEFKPAPAPVKAADPAVTPAKAGAQSSDPRLRGDDARAEPKAAPAPKLEGFAIQVGAFRDEEKLQQAREKLKAARIAHFVERRAAGDLTRLRAGPYPTREAAEKARAQVKAAGFDGQVVTLP